VAFGEVGRTLTQVSRSFPHNAGQIPVARRFVRDVLDSWGLLDAEQLVQDTLLVASELVTNAVLHGMGEVEVSVSMHGDGVRLEVCDQGPLWVPRRPAPSTVPGLTGRGLRIVALAASAWGTDRSPGGGTIVWAELHGA
jgi:anti-sigma regulatory factor (Ser/Thr protein kinase)